MERSGSRVCVFHPEAFDDGLDVFGLSVTPEYFTEYIEYLDYLATE